MRQHLTLLYQDSSSRTSWLLYCLLLIHACPPLDFCSLSLCMSVCLSVCLSLLFPDSPLLTPVDIPNNTHNHTVRLFLPFPSALYLLMHRFPRWFYKQVILSPLVCKVAETWGWGNRLALGKGKHQLATVYNDLIVSSSIFWSSPRCFTGPRQIPAFLVSHHSGARKTHRLQSRIRWGRGKRLMTPKPEPQNLWSQSSLEALYQSHTHPPSPTKLLQGKHLSG